MVHVGTHFADLPGELVADDVGLGQPRRLRVRAVGRVDGIDADRPHGHPDVARTDRARGQFAEHHGLGSAAPLHQESLRHARTVLDAEDHLRGAGHHEQVRAQPEQLRHVLDRPGTVEDDLATGGVGEPFREVAQRERQAFQTDEVLDDEAASVTSSRSCSGRWQ